jgi:hypothetical protein
MSTKKLKMENGGYQMIVVDEESSLDHSKGLNAQQAIINKADYDAAEKVYLKWLLGGCPGMNGLDGDKEDTVHLRKFTEAKNNPSIIGTLNEAELYVITSMRIRAYQRALVKSQQSK